MRTRLVTTLGCLALLALGASPDPRERPASDPRERPATAPATRPVVSLLLGTYRGSVVDDDQLVPCVTTFRLRDGQIVGEYVVREGAERYVGTLDRFELISDERRECRFHWRDKHGEGTLSVAVAAEGAAFAGSWGLEVEQDRLVWHGTRVDAPGPQVREPARRAR